MLLNNISQLLRRQQSQTKQKSEREGKRYHHTEMHEKSTASLDPVEGNSDVEAKQNLLKFACEKSWLAKTFCKSKKMKCRIDAINGLVRVWDSKHSEDSASGKNIPLQ